MIANKGLASSSIRDYLLVYDPAIQKFTFSVGNGTVAGYVSSQQTIAAGQWYTIIAWHDAVNNSINIQVNNGIASTVSYSSGAMDTTYPLSIGAHSIGTYGLNGRIDEMVLYKRVLTASERAWMYNNGMGRSYADLTSSNPGMTNLSAWWSLNETSGVRNDSFSTSHLSDNNTVGYATGVQGYAASFVTANQEYLSRVDSVVLSTGNVDFTLVANVYLNSTSDIMVIANKGDMNNQNVRDYSLYYGAGSFGFRVGNGSTTASVSSPQIVTTGAWYTIVAWHDAVNNTINIQVNNGIVSTVSYSGGAMDTTFPLSIGAHSNGSYGLDGRIDEVTLYKRVLTAAERSWLYNSGVRRTFADLSAPVPSALTTYTYDGTHKHAVTALSTGESYTYDANGNMIIRVESGVTYNQTFDAENRLISVTAGGATTQFIYDGDGNLVKKVKPGGSRTLYVAGIYEVDKNSGGTVTGTKTYYPAAGAMRIDNTLYYVLKDHLGSASVVTSATGTTVGQARYYPFGETRTTTGTMLTDKLYTGQRQMAELGIYHYGARFYSPYINRFVSADTIVPNPANPQSLNRYSYVMNNPLRYIDPTGHMFTDDQCGFEGQDCAGYLGGTGGGVGNGDNGGDDGDEEDEDEPNISQQLQYCLQHPFAPQCATPPEDTLTPIQPNYEFIAPWQFNHLDAWGFRFNGTGCMIIVCGDISLDLIGNLTTGEGTLFVTPGIHFGLGYGVDGSAGLVGAYDTPSNNSLAGASQNLSLNITPGTGGQGSYSASESPNVTGNYAQTYSLSVSAGGEASAVYGPSYSIPIVTCTSTTCYWGVQ